MKAHLFTCATPLREGSDVESLCGKKIERVKFAMALDSVLLPGASLGAMGSGICEKCEGRFSLQPRGGYIYAIVSGKVK